MPCVSPGTPVPPAGSLTQQVPPAFFQVRAWLALLVLLWTLWVGVGLATASDIFAWEPLGSCVLAGVQIALWTLSLAMWCQVRLAGFWVVAAYAHIALLVQAIRCAAGVYHSGASYGASVALWPLLLLFAVATSVWSPGLLDFFVTLNGSCPACKSAPLSEPQLEHSWCCPECKKSLIWVRCAAPEMPGTCTPT